MTAPTPRTRDALTPVARAVSDALDDLLFRHHGIETSWSSPETFIELLDEAGFEVVPKRVVLSDEQAQSVFSRAVFFAQVREENGFGDMDDLVLDALRSAGIRLVREAS